jgi:hypothetical protein
LTFIHTAALARWQNRTSKAETVSTVFFRTAIGVICG